MAGIILGVIDGGEKVDRRFEVQSATPRSIYLSMPEEDVENITENGDTILS